MKYFLKSFSLQLCAFIAVIATLWMVYAAWNDTVNSGDPLSSSSWNTLVWKVSDMDNLMTFTWGRIGIWTSTPTRRLEVFNGDIYAAGTADVRVDNDRNFWWWDLSTRITGNSATDYFAVLTNGGQERLRVDASGNVGIGTSSPSMLLHTYSATTNSVAQFESGDPSVNIRFNDSNTTNTVLFWAEGNSAYIWHVSWGYKLHVLNSGDVGIGTDSPAGKLDVVGSIVTGDMWPNGSVTNTQEGVHLSPDGYGWFATTNVGWDYPLYAQQLTPGGGWLVYFVSEQTLVWTISTNGSSTSYNATSDLRLKENIVEIETPLNTLNEIRGVRYNWKNTGKQDIWVIAQEVEEVLPEIVLTNDNGIKSVDYSKLAPLLIEAIKELKSEKDSEIKKLQEEIEILKSNF